MRILFLSGWFPVPPNNGSKIRIYNLLRNLGQSQEITLLSFADQEGVAPKDPRLHSICCDVQVVPRKAFAPNGLRSSLGLFFPTPRLIRETFSSDMAQRIQELTSATKYDLVIASQLGTASYRQYFSNIPALFEEVEVGVYYDSYKNASSARQRLRNGLTWAKHRRYLARLLPQFQACTVASEREKYLVSGIAPHLKSMEVIPNFIELADYDTEVVTPQPNSLIFTGSFRYHANYDAMVWFLQEVYPRILEQLPEVSITITGDHRNLPLPYAKGVNLTGFVPDIRPTIASAGVSLVPLRVGGGTRLKIIEAMALGVPVVSTSKGAEGLEAVHGQHLFIGDTKEDFAENVIRLLKDPVLRQGLADRARIFVKQRYSSEVVMPRFENLINNIRLV